MRPGTARRAILSTMSPDDYADRFRAAHAAQESEPTVIPCGDETPHETTTSNA